MPAIAPNSTVLVTGANGFLALWIVKTLLERGYTVRAAVRQGRAETLKQLFSSYGDKLEIVYVNDIEKVRICGYVSAFLTSSITQAGAFDEAQRSGRNIAYSLPL